MQDTPFDQYPQAFSPLKPVFLRNSSATSPNKFFSPLRPSPNVNTLLAENDIFAISPGMFPRKTKPIDYLDILFSADRTEFMSPLKPKLNKERGDHSIEPVAVIAEQETPDVSPWKVTDLEGSPGKGKIESNMFPQPF
jgi:hypothetical protein